MVGVIEVGGSVVVGGEGLAEGVDLAAFPGAGGVGELGNTFSAEVVHAFAIVCVGTSGDVYPYAAREGVKTRD